MSKIYTRGGDKGTTSLADGRRVPKNHIRVDAYGAVDELVSTVALARSIAYPCEETRQQAALVDAALKRIQEHLMVAAARLSTATPEDLNMPTLGEHHIEELEKEIDEMQLATGALTSFILLGGVQKATTLQLCRTVTRRCERRVLDLADAEAVEERILRFLNRLADWFFAAGRYVNHICGHTDEPWTP